MVCRNLSFGFGRQIFIGILITAILGLVVDCERGYCTNDEIEK